MRIIYRDKLFRFYQIDPRPGEFIVSWFKKMAEKQYHSWPELRQDFGAMVAHCNKSLYKFYISRSRYVIVARISFVHDLVMIVGIQPHPYKRIRFHIRHKRKMLMWHKWDTDLTYAKAARMVHKEFYLFDDFDKDHPRVINRLKTASYVYRYEEVTYPIDKLRFQPPTDVKPIIERYKKLWPLADRWGYGKFDVGYAR